MTTFKVKPDVDFFNLLIRKREMRLDKVAAKVCLNHVIIFVRLNLPPFIFPIGGIGLFTNVSALS